MTSFNVIESDEEEGDEKPMEVRERTVFSPGKANCEPRVLEDRGDREELEVLVGEGGCADCSALSAMSACSSISQLITEEDLIDSLFHACDTRKSGQVPVSSLLDYIKCTTQATDEQGTNADLEDLWLQFDPNGVDVSVDINTCRRVMTEWVSQVRRASGSEFCYDALNQDLIEFSPAKVRPRNLDDPGGVSSSPIHKTSNVSANDRSTFESMDMHGKDSSVLKIDLMTEISELEFQNRKLHSQLLESQSQIALLDDQNTQLSSERDDLRKKLTSLHRVAETNRDLLTENLDLKTLVSGLEESDSAVRTEKNDLEKTYESRINALEDELSSVSVELEGLKAEKEILVQTNTNQSKQRRKEKKEIVKAREKINALQMQLKDCERLLCESRKAVKTMSDNGFLASPISGLLTDCDGKRRIKGEESNRSSIQDEIRSLSDELRPGLESPFCEKFCVNQFLEIDLREGEPTLGVSSFRTFAEASLTNEGPSREEGFQSDFSLSTVPEVDDGLNADLTLVCRKGNFVQHLCARLLMRHWNIWTTNDDVLSPNRSLVPMDPNATRSQTDAATQGLKDDFTIKTFLPKVEEAFADLRSYACHQTDPEDWSFTNFTQEVESKDSAEILSALRNHLEKIEALVSVLLANLPLTNASNAALQLARCEQRAGRNPPLNSQQASHDSNNMSIDSGLPVDLSPSSPEGSSKFPKRCPKDGRFRKQVLLPDIKSRSLDQSQGVQEGRVGKSYRRTLSCPVLQSRCSLIAKGIQTDVSCLRMAVDDERMFRTFRQPENAKDTSETTAGVQAFTVAEVSSATDFSSYEMPSSNCPSHGSHKLPMLPEEDHEDPSSPLPSAAPLRHTSHMFLNLRIGPPPYRPPPPPPLSPACAPSNILPGDAPCSEDRGHDQTPVSSHVRASRTSDIEAEERSPRQPGSRSAEPEPKHLLRRHSSKRRLGFEGSSTVIRRSAAVELDEFDSPVVDVCEADAKEVDLQETRSPKATSVTKPVADSEKGSPRSEEEESAVEPLKWSELAQLASWTSKRRKSSIGLESLSEHEIEDEFNRLSLANRLDKSTLGQRLELHRRQRDLAERDVEKELVALKTTLNDVQAKSQTFSDAEVRHSLTRIQQRVDVVQGAVARVSGRAEAYGGIQKEKKNCQDFALLIKYAEMEKNRCKQFEKQLEEVRQMNQRLSNENAIHQLISSSPGGAAKTINGPLMSRRRASVAIDSYPALEAVGGLCNCPKMASPEAQGGVRVNAVCPVHSARFKSGRRSSICAAIVPFGSSGPNKDSSSSPTAILEAAPSYSDSDNGTPTCETRISEDDAEEHVFQEALCGDGEQREIERQFLEGESCLGPLSEVFESFEWADEEDDESIGDVPSQVPRAPRRWQEAELCLSLRYFAVGLLIVCAVWTLFSSFFLPSWPFASGASRHSNVPCSWYSWEELFRPYLMLRHHSSPPV